MSTLTKILIVLLTVSSVFLCGVMVVYVATTNNYKQKYKDLRAERDAWVMLYLSFLEHETLNERVSHGHLTPFNVPSVVPIASLLTGGSSLEI